jgi:uncharacterized membrane protein YjgN (DUF898 family)
MTDTLAFDAAPPGSPAIPVPAAPAPRTEAFRFTGEAAEYFRIWIVNLFLSVVTLGLYSPWAKVRKKRYFHGNTWVAGANFEYHGNPIAILKGRLIAFAAFALYTVASHFSEKLAAGLLLAMLPAVPWLLVQSFAFNAANSSYRNLRFRFTGSYRQALAAIAPLAAVPVAALLAPEIEPGQVARDWRGFGYVMLTPLLFLAVYPYVIAKVKLLHIAGTRFGTAAFECRAGVGRFYGIYLAGVLFFSGLMAIAGVIVAFASIASPWLMMGVGMTGYFLGGAMALALVNSSTANYLFRSTRMQGVGGFRSKLTVGRLAGIYLVNLVAIALTVGLAVPWAAVRTARYRAQCLSLETDGGLEAVAANAAADVTATGDEMGEMFGVDLSL